jgi:DNA polymerase I-like protein with 3'-5' exonuclease and polymerase domains
VRNRVSASAVYDRHPSCHNQRRQAAERAAINAPMQGTAADLIKMAMVATHAWLTQRSARSALIMQVHDELVLEVPTMSSISSLRSCPN